MNRLSTARQSAALNRFLRAVFFITRSSGITWSGTLLPHARAENNAEPLPLTFERLPHAKTVADYEALLPFGTFAET